MTDDSIVEGETNPTEKRIKDLSEKVKLTATERDEQKRLLDEQTAKTQALEQERDFLNSFGDQLGKFPEASGFKDKIKEKVLKGYSIEDATISTLASEGKYTPPKAQTDGSHVGGSAINQPITGGEKPLSQMTKAEKLAKLVELEQSGEDPLLNSLRR